ncbi:hypothetical protein GCM10018966_007110 [Streptomyces yanii]
MGVEELGQADFEIAYADEDRVPRREALTACPFQMPNEPHTHNPESLDQLTRRLNDLLAPDADDRGRCASCGTKLKAPKSSTRFCSTVREEALAWLRYDEPTMANQAWESVVVFGSRPATSTETAMRKCC